MIESRNLRTGYLATIEEGRNAFKILTGKSTEKRSRGRPRHRWDDRIRMELKEIDVNTKNWINLTQNRDYWRALVNAALNFQVPVMKLVNCFPNI